jgi:RHS repeat-associated protein
MNYLGDEYFYIKNLQGDIIEIVDASGTSVAKYRYDAWGNIIYQWDSGLGIANANPYRYRSYRLDSGTGLYYLNARYYDPSIGRFISADSINYLDPSSGQGLNLYAYCGNNPVMYTDITGYLPEWLENTLAIGGVVLLVAGIAVAAVFTGGLAGAALMAVAFSTGIGASSGFSKAIEEDTSIAAGVLSGGIKGLATGTAIGLGIMTGGGAFSALGGLTAFGGSLAINFGAGIGSNAIDSKMNNRDFSLNNAINNGFKQMVSGAFAFAAGGLIGASGFYNIPGQTKMFSSQWFGNTASGLLFKAVYYYGIDAVIWMI